MQPGPGKKGCRDFVRQCPPHNVPVKFSGSIVVLKILHEQKIEREIGKNSMSVFSVLIVG